MKRRVPTDGAPEEPGRPPAYVTGGELCVPPDAPQTLVAALVAAAKRATPDDICYCLPGGDRLNCSFAELLAEAERIAGGLRERKIAAGECVLVLLDANQQILPAFWGCLLSGVVPVVASVPVDLSDTSRALEQLFATWTHLGPPVVITAEGHTEFHAALARQGRISAERLATFESLRAHERDARHHAAEPGDTAFLSLTSGSTGAPKCVELTHRNVLSRARGANQLGRHAASDVTLSWLPLDHIGSMSDWHLRCIVLACKMVYIAKDEILARPLRWLELIEQHRVTHSWAPNFAFGLLADAVARDRSRKWNLSCVSGLVTAGESVSPATNRRLLELLGPCGLAASAIRPAFGMAEMASGVTYGCGIGELETLASLGPPVPGIELRIVDEAGGVVAVKTVGQVQVRGDAVSRGYYRNPEASRVFHADGWFETGDLGFLSGGELYLTGRAKDTIIIRGANFSCAQIEEVVQSVAGVESSFTAACAVRKGRDEESLAVFFHTRLSEPSDVAALVTTIRREVVRQVGVNPEFLLPVDQQVISKTTIGKIERQQLKRRLEKGEFDDRIANVSSWLRAAIAEVDDGAPQTEIQRQVANIWKEVLGLENVSLHQNVFELGAHSLLLVQVHQRLQVALSCKLSVVEMFKYPTIHQLAAHLSGANGQQGAVEIGKRQAQRRQQASAEATGSVAVIGMAGRFPGAANLDQFWQNLKGGVESITRFTETQVLEAGVDPARVRDPKYVKAGPVLDGVEDFDAEFFGYTAREAELMDPQQRLLLECSWEAMENAGYNLLAYDGTVGVYAGALLNTYLLNNVLTGKRHLAEGEQSDVLTPDSLAGFLTMVASDKDYLTTRVSYKLNLRGPSINVQTACSTSLVAVHLAAESVLSGQCDLALAGGVSVKVPQEAGYLYEDDLIVSPDGHCRPMDVAASGTVFGNGCGVVVLKRFDRALADRDHIYAVIRGSAVNNDGARKVGYMAPSQDGQAAVVSEAIAKAEIDPESIGFIEAHGTATALGDPIEVGGLVDAFRSGTAKTGFCALGSVKSNVGHLQIASGIAGFMKAVLALDHKEIPPSLHFEKPNPRIDFSQSPFFVNSQLLGWSSREQPRRAGVNSLGIGGTNAHVILEEAPVPAPRKNLDDREQLLVLSATSSTALRELAVRYADHLHWHRDVSLVDLCYTANNGRVAFAERAAFVAASIEELRSQLTTFASGEDVADLKAPDDNDDRGRELRTLAERFVAGLSVDWEHVFQNQQPRRIPLPTYPFQRKRYWIDRPQKTPTRQLLRPAGLNMFEAALDTNAWPALNEHRLCGQPVAPGALHQALMLDAAHMVAGNSSVCVNNIRFQQLLPLAAGRLETVQVSLHNVERGWSTEIRDAAADEAARVFATGRIIGEATQPLPAWALAATRIDQVLSRCHQELSSQEFYRRLEAFDVQLGPPFQTITQVRHGDHEALALIRLTPASTINFDSSVQPCLLDAALQIAPALFNLRDTETLIPTEVKSLTLLQPSRATELSCYVRLHTGQSADRPMVADAVLIDDSGQAIALLEGISYQGVSRERLRQLVFAHPNTEQPQPAAANDSTSAPHRQRALTDFIRQEVSKALGLRGGQSLAADRGFAELGLDSLTSVELRNRLQQRLGCSLPATVVFDYPTINQLVAMLLARPDVKVPAIEHAAAASIPASSNGRLHAFSKRQRSEPAPNVSVNASKVDQRQERFAIVGMACRFPGSSNSPQEFWEFLERGGDASREVPADRFDIEAYYNADRSQPGKMATRRGCFLDSIDQFDAPHFGIAPREASTLDPQQRLLLEVAHEAIESAGVPINELDGSPTGVFVGISGIDYAILSSTDHEQVGPYLGTGTAHATACGRLSYVLGLQGPCLSVDTACSSSLVAVHLACQSLARGECDLALAAGVNLVTAPQIMISFSKAQMLSADGRCKSFDASADGYVRGEGVGVLVLKRLSAAIRDHDRILAVIRGTAINQDGKSSGLTVPSGPAQENVIQSALAAAGVMPAQVSYVEAHGTGTPLGDSIELAALRNVYAAGRAEPLIVGSVKTNIGHTEAVSGMAGLIKVVLALEHQQIPRHLHFENPNPHVEWDGMTVPTACLPWASTSGPRLAGVSSFGFGGTNAHVIVEQAAESVAGWPAESASARPFQVLTISAKNCDALAELSSSYREHLLLPDAGWEATCAAAALSRAHLPHRLAVIAASNEDAAEKLATFRAGGNSEVIHSEVTELEPQVGLLFSGQGSQYAGMGRELYETEPTFRRVLDRCNEILRPYLPSSLLSAVYPAEDDAQLLNQTAFTQPALFALEYSLWELWKSWGLAPSVLLGHSVGEYVAACAAGVFDLEDGLRLIATRGRLVQSLPSGGAMCAVMASAEWVEMALAQVDHQAVVAAVNGPRQVVVSGKFAAVEIIARAAHAAGIRTQMLTVSHAFHSHLLEPILDEFYSVASSVAFRPPTLPIISNLSGELADADITTPEYWCQHLRHPVQFARGIQTAAALGCELFVEAGPQATLAAMGRQCLPDARFRWLPSISKCGADWKTMLTSLATLHVSGVPLAWDKIYDKRLPRQQPLPTYAFQRKRYWLPDSLHKPAPMTHRAASVVHPLLGHETRLPGGGALFEAQLSAVSPPFLADHQVQGRPLFPGAGYVEAFIAAGQRLLHLQSVHLHDVEITRALPLSAEQAERIEIQLSQVNGEFRAEFFRRVLSGDDIDPTWTLHATSRVAAAADRESPVVDPGELRARMSDAKATTEFYNDARESGLDYGPTFQRLTSIWRGQREALGRFESSPAVAAEVDRYTLHPALFDAAFQVVGLLLPPASEGTYLPVGAESIEVFGRLPARGYSHARLRDDATVQSDLVLADLDLMDDNGRLAARIIGFRLKMVGLNAFRQTPKQQANDCLYEVGWLPQTRTGKPPFVDKGSWHIVGSDLPLTNAVARCLKEAGQVAITVGSPSSLAETADETSHLLRGVIFLAPDFATNEIEKLNGHASSQVEPLLLTSAVLSMVQELGASGRASRLILVTRGAVAVNESEAVPGVNQSPLWGLGGVIVAEHPELRCKRIDLDPTSDPAAAGELLIAELAAADDEDRVAFRSTERFVARLKSYQPPANDLLEPLDGPYRLQLTEFGVLENLQLAPLARRLPGPGEVEVAVAAAGLNFRDVLRALGMLRPFEIALGIADAADAPFGFECAGTIAALGEGVTEFAVGDEVVGVALGAMRSHVIASSRQVSRKPANLSMVEAAALPLAFLTASHALEHLANLQPGDKVLIHAAAGGVGLAAVQLALARGAEIFATASPPKWEFLRSLGVQHVFNSRTLDFADQISRQASGQGVDVVLNSLTGDFIAASLKCLRREGVFIEIGKLGIWNTDQMAVERPDVRYFAFDLGEEEAREPGMMGLLLSDVLRRMESRELTPLSHRAFPLTAARQAFRLVAQAKHRGKVVLTLDHQPSKLPLRPDGWYLITGGLGALGLKTSDWLIEQGARHLVLLGRTTPHADPQLEALARLSEKADVRFIQADAADRAALADALQQIPGPLCGVIHAAGVLDDGALVQLDQSRLAKVLAPKVNGAWNLHVLTRNQPLDFFVCFSSAAALLGSPGQANYAAANAFLDSLAHHRRALGLPALSVNWGPWAEGGMATRLSERERQRLSKMGLGWIDADTGFRLLGQLLADDVVQTAVLPIDWARYLSISNSDAIPFYHDVQVHQPLPQQSPPASILIELQTAQPAERKLLMVDYLRTEIAAVLGFDSKAVSPRGRLFDLGMDSLTAVELQNRIKRGLSIDLPTTLAFDYPTPSALSDYLLDRLGLAATTAPQPDESDAALTTQVEQYTDDEVETLLREKYQDVLRG